MVPAPQTTPLPWRSRRPPADHLFDEATDEDSCGTWKPENGPCFNSPRPELSSNRQRETWLDSPLNELLIKTGYAHASDINSCSWVWNARSVLLSALSSATISTLASWHSPCRPEQYTGIFQLWRQISTQWPIPSFQRKRRLSFQRNRGLTKWRYKRGHDGLSCPPLARPPSHLKRMTSQMTTMSFVVNGPSPIDPPLDVSSNLKFMRSRDHRVPSSWGNSWQKTATAVLSPTDRLLAKEAPATHRHTDRHTQLQRKNEELQRSS